MDIRQQLLKGHSKLNIHKIVDFVGVDPIRFEQLISVFLSGPYRVTQRAAWPVSRCVERHPQLIKPHLGVVLKFLRKPDIHDAVKRNIIRLLQFVDIPEKYQGRVLDICFDFLQDKKEPVAIQVFSMTVIFNITGDKPEIRKELITIIEDILPYASAGFRSRANKLMTLAEPNRPYANKDHF